MKYLWSNIFNILTSRSFHQLACISVILSKLHITLGLQNGNFLTQPLLVQLLVTYLSREDHCCFSGLLSSGQEPLDYSFSLSRDSSLTDTLLLQHGKYFTHEQQLSSAHPRHGQAIHPPISLLPLKA